MSEDPVKINALDLENVKRVKAVKLAPTPAGLTTIGGNNGQGKTSVLDAIAWALGGDKFRPENPKREGSMTDPELRVELSNGVIVERKGKNSALKVIDPAGNKSGQTLLNDFIESLALNLPKFMESTSKEKAKTLLNIIGVGDQLFAIEQEEQKLYDERTVVGRMEDQKRGAAEEMEQYPDAPEEEVSIAELVQQQQAILGRNGENQRLREQSDTLQEQLGLAQERVKNLEKQIVSLTEQLDDARKQEKDLVEKVETSKKTVAELQDESTEEVENSIAKADAINEMVRSNQAKAAAIAEADELKKEYDELTIEINALRDKKMKLLDGADLPLPGLNVEKGELTYNGNTWDSMSGSDQLRVATAIVRALNPKCGFVLVDKLEQMDPRTLEEFGQWARAEGLQIIATRVSTGDECSVIIEDGYAVNNKTEKPNPWAMN